MAPGAGRHDDGEFDHSQNDELRMCGMAGDDEDDDVREDAVVLFGRSAADPLPVDDSDPQSTWLMPTVARARLALSVLIALPCLLSGRTLRSTTKLRKVERSGLLPLAFIAISATLLILLMALGILLDILLSVLRNLRRPRA